MLKNLSNEDEFDSLLQNNHDKLVLVKFSTVWCPPCQELQKNIKKLLIELEQSAEPEKELVVLEIDAEKFPRLAQRAQFRIQSVPTTFLFRQGIMIKNISGSMSVQQLKKFIGI
ncbi:thioredoxin family protein [endosymbiont GvMRE of Glomus versiforme]|uniref:thioredoxin family protein n=1 Tax=endosymbiont GvMRE of Glomus versiforme TaxID=2039283 RepID=UPI0015590A6C|nr:thioredoxin family protein [endosymbiont GvMRE of Glomus versiforme]